MARPTISMPDELLEEFDDKIDQKKLNEEFDLDTNRSEVFRELARQWVEGNLTLTKAGSGQIAHAD